MFTFHAQSCHGYREKRWTDGRKDTRTHTHTDRPTAITLAAHARRRGLIIYTLHGPSRAFYTCQNSQVRRERERERDSLLVEVEALVQPLTQVLDPQVSCHIHLPVEQSQGARFLGTRRARGFGEGGWGGDVRVGGVLLLPWRLGR